jgi:hypothetical protein
MSVAPAGTTNVLVVVSGVVQDPSTYGVVGTTITFSGAPPSGTGNISCRYLGIPVTGVTTTAYRTKTEFTATAGQTTFTPPSYTVGYIDVFRNGVLLGSTDYTASNGTTVVLTAGATAGDLITTESFYVSSVLNAIPNIPASVGSSNLAALSYLPTSGSNLTLPTGGGTALSTANPQSGGVIQVVSSVYTSSSTTTSTTPVTTGLSVAITPKFSTSKIFIIASYNLDNNTSGNNSFSTIYRNGSTNLGVNGYFGQVYANGARSIVSICSSFLDSPATTSSTTYAIYFAIPAGGTIGFNTNNQSCTITAMEIAA